MTATFRMPLLEDVDPEAARLAELRVAEERKRKESATDEKAVPSRELPSFTNPMLAARALAPEYPQPLTWWRGDFYRHLGTHWEVVDEAELTRWLYRQTENAYYVAPTDDGDGRRPWAPNRRRVGDVQHALAYGVLQRTSEEHKVMALTNGVLLPDRILAPHSVDRFNLSSLPFGYDPDATCPEWFAFLDSTLPGAQASKNFLGEWFGYTLSGRTDMQKACALVGPPRCGKGTTARILQAMVGPNGWAAPTLARLGGNFGMESLIGKNLAVMGDVRWTSKHVIDAVPILLGLTGEDGFTVPRKNREDWIGKLGARIMLMSNDAPNFTDASGALAGRLVYVAFHHSFFGREDRELEGRLMGELPGILNWALGGLDRLNTNGRFTQSESSLELAKEVANDASPVAAWADEVCTFDSEATFYLDTLRQHYVKWLTDKGRQAVYTDTSRFSRELRSALGDRVKISRKTAPTGHKYQEAKGLRPLPGSLDFSAVPDR